MPLFNDAAADVPPAGRLSEYFHQGFDLVAFSGGKAIRGPQSTGLLVGRPDLIAAGRQAISPHMGIGRGMKVGKEEIVGLLAAIERFVEARSRRGVADLGNASRRDDRDTRRDPRDDRPARRARNRQSLAPRRAGMEPVAFRVDCRRSGPAAPRGRSIDRRSR